MFGFIRRNISEIEGSRGLHFLGASLSLVHVIFIFSAYFSDWWIARDMDNAGAPICHAFWEECYKWRIFDINFWKAYLGVEALLGCFCSFLFLTKRIRPAFYLLFFLEIMKMVMPLWDYRIWHMHFYMSCLVTLSFLFLSPKPFSSSFTLALMYFWAGWLKLNPHWLSGSLVNPPIWKYFPSYLDLQVRFVILMEIVLVWFVFSKRLLWFSLIIAILIIFHLASWHIVTFFYPLVMFCLLTTFLIQFIYFREQSFKKSFNPYNVIFFTILCLLQIPPYFVKEEDLLKGGGRMFYSLYMFHRHIDCHAEVTYEKDGKLVEIDLHKQVEWMSTRTACQPLVTINIARHLCRTANIKVPLTATHYAKFTEPEKFREVYRIEDFCSKEIDYLYWTQNDWMNQL